MRRTRSLLPVALPAALLVAAAAVALGWAFWLAEHTLTRSAEIARTQHQIGFTMRALDAAEAASANRGFEPVLSRDNYSCGAMLDGELYLGGPAGLSIYAPDGSLRERLRTGLELPVAPIVAVVSGRLRGSDEAEILLATAGAGVLVLTPSERGPPRLRQLLPGVADARDIAALLPLASGDLLLGTRHAGVLVFDGKTLEPFGATARLAVQITTLAAPDAASLLIGTRDAGVFFIHAGTVQHADTSNGMPDNQVEALVTRGERAFVGTPLGVAEFDLTEDGAATLRPARILAPGVFCHALALSSGDGVLLVGSLDQGIAEVALGVRPRLRPVSFAQGGGESTQRIDQFVTGSELYAIADGSLLARTSNAWRSALAKEAETLADRNISALAFAPDGRLYVGFFDHGVDIVQPAETGVIRHLEDDHLFCVNRLVLDPARQTIAAATANGLVLFDSEGTPRQVLTRRDGLISDHVTDIAYTNSGLTLATPAGLTFVTTSGTDSLYAFQGLVNNHVYALSASGDRLLAGTLGGLSTLDAGVVKRNFTAANSGLKHNWITALAAAPQGGWLIGTYGAGVETLSADGSRFTAAELPAGTPHDLVINPNAMLVTRTHVYAGTLGHGMLVFDSAAGRWSVVTAGLPSLNVTAFAEHEGELYVGTENGLMRVREDRLP